MACVEEGSPSGERLLRSGPSPLCLFLVCGVAPLFLACPDGIPCPVDWAGLLSVLGGAGAFQQQPPRIAGGRDGGTCLSAGGGLELAVGADRSEAAPGTPAAAGGEWPPPVWVELRAVGETPVAIPWQALDSVELLVTDEAGGRGCGCEGSPVGMSTGRLLSDSAWRGAPPLVLYPGESLFVMPPEVACGAELQSRCGGVWRMRARMEVPAWPDRWAGSVGSSGATAPIPATWGACPAEAGTVQSAWRTLRLGSATGAGNGAR
jgi:hypothetical protein